MGLDDLCGSRVAVAVAATATVMSPRARKALRRGAVYGIAGALAAGDALSAATHGAREGARQAAASAGGGPETGEAGSPAPRS